MFPTLEFHTASVTFFEPTPVLQSTPISREIVLSTSKLTASRRATIEFGCLSYRQALNCKAMALATYGYFSIALIISSLQNAACEDRDDKLDLTNFR